MFDAYLAQEEGMPGRGNVTRGVDALVARPQVLVDHDPVVDLQSGGDRELGAADRAHSDDHEVCGDPVTVFGHDLLDGSPAAEGLDPSAHPHLDAVVVMQGPVHRRDFGPDHLLQRCGVSVDHGDFPPELAGRNTRALLDALHPDDRETFGFDVDEIDWDHYLGEVHLPALRKIAVPPAPGPKKTKSPGRRPRPGGPARAGHLRR